MRYMTREAIDARPPDPPPRRGEPVLARARRAMRALGLDGPDQQMGRRWPVACVALEITQRCNLDCTACYLSELSEAVRDLPLEEVFRRIDLIHAHYGPGTDVQVTGGDPTLRRRDELVAIVARIRSRGLRPTLMTNGIRASAPLLAELARHGLCDVVFHVDTTQERRGFGDEASLDRLRERYIVRARAAGLQVMFNTTVHDGNVHEVPHLVRFFRRHATDVRTASFQPLADTGRGVLGPRAPAITLERVIALIERGAGTAIRFDASRIGHPRCSRYGLCLALGDTLHDLFRDAGAMARVQAVLAPVPMNRDAPWRTAAGIALALARAPRALAAALRVVAGLAWRGRREWPGALLARRRVSTLSFTVHAFMDAERLEAERIEACVFKVMTARGPVSMCLHNARRDEFITAPVIVHDAAGPAHWAPLSGRVSIEVPPPSRLAPAELPPKRRKGRTRAGQPARISASTSGRARSAIARSSSSVRS